MTMYHSHWDLWVSWSFPVDSGFWGSQSTCKGSEGTDRVKLQIFCLMKSYTEFKIALLKYGALKKMFVSILISKKKKIVAFLTN